MSRISSIPLILISFFIPLMQKRMLLLKRQMIMRSIEKKRNSRVISMIHRQEVMSFFGFPLARYIDIEDSEAVLRAIRMTPPDMQIDLVLHTPGGLVLAAEQIACALKRHKGNVTVFIPHYAMSGGSLIAMAADEISMDPNAVLGHVDPQLGGQQGYWATTRQSLSLRPLSSPIPTGMTRPSFLVMWQKRLLTRYFRQYIPCCLNTTPLKKLR
ncbi:MAG: ATP-dependent Clp protease proteolytic subunit [Candidatus Methanoperedens sp.]|nr:ATP-dependent Clp protease proteolytic subunit [Candidatus Methanoperedens sp.]